MADRWAAIRAALGRVGIWSFALQGHGASEEGAAVTAYEALGFRATWFPETVGSKEALAHAGLLLAASSRMVVGTGIANIYARDPMAMANGARSARRGLSGPVRARDRREPRAVGCHPGERLRAARGADDRVPGRHGRRCLLRPPRRRCPFRWCSRRSGRRMLELAAARAAGAHPYFVPAEHTAIARERLGKEPLLVVEQTAVLDTDRKRARETARAFAGHYLGPRELREQHPPPRLGRGRHRRRRAATGSSMPWSPRVTPARSRRASGSTSTRARTMSASSCGHRTPRTCASRPSASSVRRWEPWTRPEGRQRPPPPDANKPAERPAGFHGRSRHWSWSAVLCRTIGS